MTAIDGKITFGSWITNFSNTKTSSYVHMLGLHVLSVTNALYKQQSMLAEGMCEH